MKQILDTKQLKAGKSTYIIDLVAHNEKLLFIEILQSIKSNTIDGGSISLHPDALVPLIKTLQEFQEQMLAKEPKKSIALSEVVKDKIQKRYFDMVEIKDIAMQLELKEWQVIGVLKEREIEIVYQKRPWNRFWRNKKK